MEPVAAEPIVASELEPIAVVEPAVVAVPTEPVVETATQPSMVDEQSVVAENPVAIELAPAIDAIAETTIVEPVPTVEQSAPTDPEPAVSQSGDLGLTPQSTPNEALKTETTLEFQPMEAVTAVVLGAPESAQTHTRPAVVPAKIPCNLLASFSHCLQKGVLKFKQGREGNWTALWASSRSRRVS